MLTQEQLQELETAHGRIARVVGKPYPKIGEDATKAPPAWEVVYRQPKRAEVKMFRAKNSKNDPESVEALARQCVVFPSKEAFDALLDEWPAIPEASAEALGRLMGVQVKELGED